MKTIIAIDAGFENCGFAVVQLPAGKVAETGVVTTKKSHKKNAVRVADDDFERCRVLLRSLADVIQRHQCAAIIVELPHGGAQSSRAVRCMALASAVIAGLVEQFALPVECITPDHVKNICNPKAKTKNEVQQAVFRHFGWGSDIGKLSEHEADALGAYIAARSGNTIRCLSGGAA